MATQHATKNDEKELVHRLVLWKTSKDQSGNWMYRVREDNPLHYSLLTNFVSKGLAAKAAMLNVEKRRQLVSELKGESAASAYRGVIFEADAIDRLVRGGTFTLRKCKADAGASEEVQLKVQPTEKRYAMADLESLNVTDSIDRIVVPDARNFESVDAFRVSRTSIIQQTTAGSTNGAVATSRHIAATKTKHHSGISPAHYEALQFRMTVGESHPTKLKGVKNVLEKFKTDLPNPDITCGVVFVVPDDVQGFYEKPQSVLTNAGTVRVKCDKEFNDGNQYRLVIKY